MSTMYGYVVQPPRSLGLSSFTMDTSEYRAPRQTADIVRFYLAQVRRPSNKLSECLVNAKRAMRCRNSRRARYWVNVGQRWGKRLKALKNL